MVSPVVIRQVKYHAVPCPCPRKHRSMFWGKELLGSAVRMHPRNRGDLR